MALLILASQPGNLGNVSGEFIIGFVGAIAAGLSLVLGKYWGRKAEKEERSVTISGQPLTFQSVAASVSWNDHKGLVERVERLEGHIDAMRDEQSEQYRSILNSGSERELRLTETISAGLRAVHERLDGFFKPQTRR